MIRWLSGVISQALELPRRPDVIKPERWKVQKNKIFTYQVGFTSPLHDFDAAPSDFLRISADNVGAHGRMLHVPDYAHELSQRVDNFHLLEEFVTCMSNNGADACGQFGINWVHRDGKKPDEIRDICNRIGDTYETPFHMAGYCVVEAYCDAVGIPSIEEALSWEPGERDEVSWYDGGSWHANLRGSDGLKAQPRRYIDISEAPDRVREIYQTVLPHYQHLYQYRLSAAGSNGLATG